MAEEEGKKMCDICKKHSVKTKTHKKCTSCYINKFIEEFDKYRLGHNKFCKKCVSSKKLDIADETEKNCYKCKKIINIKDFPKNKSTYDGYNNSCTICNNEKGKLYRESLILTEKVEKTTKNCNTCKIDKPVDEFFNRRISDDGKDLYCKSCKAAKNSKKS